jgi:hypothetical protein
MGAEMPVRDRTRNTILKQRRVIADTASTNWIKLSGDFTSSAIIDEIRPDGTAFGLRACDRVYGINVMDQSNGQAECSTTDALVEEIALAFFPRMFTYAGTYLADRIRDLDKLGAFGRGRRL